MERPHPAAEGQAIATASLGFEHLERRLGLRKGSSIAQMNILGDR
jgi:hypothetical protein